MTKPPSNKKLSKKKRSHSSCRASSAFALQCVCFISIGYFFFQYTTHNWQNSPVLCKMLAPNCKHIYIKTQAQFVSETHYCTQYNTYSYMYPCRLCLIFFKNIVSASSGLFTAQKCVDKIHHTYLYSQYFFLAVYLMLGVCSQSVGFSLTGKSFFIIFFINFYPALLQFLIAI